MMPQLVKGGKWAYGWVCVSPQCEIVIPPQAWEEYTFCEGKEALFITGSRRSGGFALSTLALWGERTELPGRGAMRLLGRAELGPGRVRVPEAVGVQAGQRLLAVRGSCTGLGFVARGPIYEEALRHPELELFGPSR
jgi:hypothetical protein